MKIKKIVSFVLLLTCMVCLGLSFLVTDVKTAKAQEPTVSFVSIHNDNNTAWGGSETTRTLRLVFSKNFTAKAYDGNEGGYDAPIIADVRQFTKINGQSLGNLSFLQIENENSITFLYDKSLLAVPEGQDYTTFTIEAGAPFGGEYLPAVTLYLVDDKWQATEPEAPAEIVAMDDKIGISTWGLQENDTCVWMNMPFTGFASAAVDWNSATEEQITKNNGVDPFDYVIINGKTAREHVDADSTVMTLHTYTGWEEAFVVKIKPSYLGVGEFTFQLKAGFTLVGNDGKVYVLQNDTKVYGWNDGTFGEYVEGPALGTPDVEFVEIHNDNNNSVWGGTTRAVRLTFSENFNAKAYDGNDGGYYGSLIADVRNFVKINGQSLENLTFVQIDNENSITFLYDVSLLRVPSGKTQTVFTIEEGAPFGGHYLPAVTLYFNGENWQTEETTVEVQLTGIVAAQNNSVWSETQKAVRVEFNYNFNNTENYNINDTDGLNLISKLTFNGAHLTGSDVLVFTEDIGGNTITILYNNSMLDWDLAEGLRYHTLSLTESVNYLGVDIPAFTLYLRNGAWTSQYPELVELKDVETAVGYNTSSLIHIRDWNLDGDDTTAVNNMILFFLPSGGFPEGHNYFLNLDKVAEYNVFDKIKLHMITPNANADEDGFVTLGQVFNAGGWHPTDLSGGKDKIVVVNMWETVNCVAFSMGAEYTAESFDYIIIEEGCEFPNYYYTNGNGAIDYVQNGEYVDYENVDKVSFIQTCDVKIYTNPDDFQGPSLNTNWAIDTNMGEVTVSGVDYKDGFVIIELEGSNYPMDGNENLNVSAGNAPISLNMLADIYVNGISLYDRVVAFGANGITSYYNYDGYSNFAISVVLANANEVVTEIIVAKDLRVPIYGMTEMASAAYGVMYTETVETVSYTKGEQGFAKDETVYWTIIFNDGENITTVKVADGETLGADDMPEIPSKEGFEFVAWVYGIDGIYTFEATSAIKTSYYLTASWTEKVETSEPTKDSESQSSSNGGCLSTIGSIDALVGLLLVAGGALFAKKKRA